LTQAETKPRSARATFSFVLPRETQTPGGHGEASVPDGQLAEPKDIPEKQEGKTMAITSIPGSLPAGSTAIPAALLAANRSSGSASSLDPARSANTESPATQALSVVAQPSREQIDQAMAQVKEALPEVAQNLQFSLDEETGRTIVKVVDSGTNEVIRQIPSEELVAISKALDAFTGLLIKQKA
jgi:flagellar protein FlaG